MLKDIQKVRDKIGPEKYYEVQRRNDSFIFKSDMGPLNKSDVQFL